MDAEYIQGAIGAVVGFTLAQLVNVAKLLLDWCLKPRLKIEASEDCRALHHTAQTEHGYLDEEIYAFSVSNKGFRIATGVRFQLIKIEKRESDAKKFETVSDEASDLAPYIGSDVTAEPNPAVLVPGAAISVRLGKWREDYPCVIPAVRNLPDYFEEMCDTADEFRFTVIAFDDKARHTKKVLTVPG